MTHGVTFGLYHNGSLVKRHSTRWAAITDAIERHLAYRCSVDSDTPGVIFLREGVEVRDITDQLDLEELLTGEVV